MAFSMPSQTNERARMRLNVIFVSAFISLRTTLSTLCPRWLARLLPNRQTPAPFDKTPRPPFHSFLVDWLAKQPAQSVIVLTVDPATGELLAIKSLPQTQLPAALQVTPDANQANAWQALDEHELRRVNFDAAKLLAEQEEKLIATEDLLAAQRGMLAELATSNERVLAEVGRLRRTVSE
jgi:hypothetical protein